MNLEKIFLVVLTIWLLGVTFGTSLLFSFFSRLKRGASGIDLKKVLEKILENQEKHTGDIKKLKDDLEEIARQSSFHVQKVGLVRFNPFNETGGDHSFSLAILDGNDNGAVITTLHTRERTRIYAKAIKNAKSEVELSNEEKKAVTKALKH